MNTNAVPSSAADDAEAADDTEAADDAEASDADQEAADKVAALIDAIYVQERTDDTDAQCKEAKEAWDALTDAQKELVEGEEEARNISDAIQEMLPRMILVTRMRSVRTSFLW